MNLKESRINNFYNIEKCENYFSLKKDSLKKYILELEKDRYFLKEISSQINFIKFNYGFKKGIFKNKIINNIHEFSFLRILIYCLVRHFKPKNILETGVYYGGNTLFLLKAIKKNNTGNIFAIDLPDKKIKKIFKKNIKKYRHPLVKLTESYTTKLVPGFIVPIKYNKNLNLVLGEATKEINKTRKKFDFYVHDSDHSFNYLSGELKAVEKKMSKKNGIMIIDDIDWSNAFYSHVCKKKYYPMLFSDNGKSNLRTRIGLIYKEHKYNFRLNFTK